MLHRQVLSPLDLERVLGLTGGHALHGEMSPDQLFMNRPVRGYADYRTPIAGLYLCGAGTHPGGGVSGANGRNCATEALRDLRRGSRWPRGRDDRKQMTMTDLWPHVDTALPGPKSAALFDRMDKVAAAPMQDHDEAPFVEVRKEGSLIIDADDNVFADLVSGWGAAPFGSTPNAVTDAVIAAQRRYGMEIFDYVQSDVPSSSPRSWWRSPRPGSPARWRR